MTLRSVAPHFLALSSLLAAGCCPNGGLALTRDPGFSNAGTRAGVQAPLQAEGEVECTLCASLGIDVDTDAALLGVGFVADGLLPSGFGAEANLEIGQGSEDESFDYDPFGSLGKTAGYGSDYRVLWLNLHGRYPIPIGDNPDLSVVPLAGVGYYRWTLNDCEDPFDAGFCDAYTTTSLDLGAELRWKQFGLKAILPVGDGPDLAMRVRYHLPIGRAGG